MFIVKTIPLNQMFSKPTTGGRSSRLSITTSDRREDTEINNLKSFIRAWVDLRYRYTLAVHCNYPHLYFLKYNCLWCTMTGCVWPITGKTDFSLSAARITWPLTACTNMKPTWSTQQSSHFIPILPSSSSSAFPAKSLEFTIWVRFLHIGSFFNPTTEAVTFCLRGWCMLGVFLLLPFTRQGHECQDLLSLCDGTHVCTD